MLSAWGVGTGLRRMLGIRLGRMRQYPPRPLSLPAIQAASDADLPCIALVTPSLNQGQFIGETVRSVLGQHYPNVQYIVQDACSTDGTRVVLDALRGEGVDIRIEPDEGQADALNMGFSRTTGEVMGYLNSDDLLMPGCMDMVGRYFRDHPDVDIVYGNRLIVDANGYEIGRWILPGQDARVLRFVEYVPQESMFWRRRLWERTGARFDTRLQFALDWDLVLRFLDAGAAFAHLPGLFGIFRAHEEQKSQARFLEQGSREMALLRSRYARDTNRLERAVLHWKYLAAHRRYDAAYASEASNGVGAAWRIH
jgi:glycosyltransferase involved in cell wall biosynthesis